MDLGAAERFVCTRFEEDLHLAVKPKRIEPGLRHEATILVVQPGVQPKSRGMSAQKSSHVIARTSACGAGR